MGAGVFSGVLGFLGTGAEGSGAGVGVFQEPLPVLEVPGLLVVVELGLFVPGLFVAGLLLPGRVLEENAGEVVTLLRVWRWVGLVGDALAPGAPAAAVAVAEAGEPLRVLLDCPILSRAARMGGRLLAVERRSAGPHGRA